MAIRHTPGPWKAVRVVNEHWINGQYWEALARVADTPQIVQDNGEPDQGPANTALICAAPEMLDALKFVFRAEQMGIPLTVETCQKIQAAIDKAEGR